MANKRKKNYRRETVDLDRSQDRLDEYSNRHISDALIDDILMDIDRMAERRAKRESANSTDADSKAVLTEWEISDIVPEKKKQDSPPRREGALIFSEFGEDDRVFAEETEESELFALSDEPEEHKPVEHKPVEQKPVEQSPVEPQPEEQQSEESQPAEQELEVQQPEEPQPEELQPEEQQPAEQELEVQQPKEQQPEELQPAEQASEELQAPDEEPAAESMEISEETIEDAEMQAELSASIMAAIAEKANKPVEKPAEKPAATEKKKKATKKKTPEIQPLKPILSIANIVYTAVAFGVITVAFLALPRGDVSETEQRSLAVFPEFSYESLLNGDYTNGITDYFNDNIPFRDDLKKVAAQLRNLYGVNYQDAEIIGPVAVVTEEEEPVPAETVITTVTATAPPETTPAATTADRDVTTEPAATTAETTVATTTAATTTASTVVTTKNVNEIAAGVITNGQVVTKLSDGHWWAISLFGGGKGTTYANALNRFKQELGDSVNVYSMPIPTAGEYYLPDTYSQYTASHHKSIESIDSQLSGVISVPGDMALWEHIDEDIYLRTDHHWQPLGAYYAAKCFAETAGVPFADISTMERVDIPGYMGTMYGFTESANLLSDPEVFTYYKPSNSYTTYYYDTAYNYDYSFPFFIPMPVNGSYSTFMGADNKIVRIKTDAGTGRKLVVFKDSYGNAEIPFYFGSFDEVYVCDIRYFDLNAVQFVKFTGATDLLFTMCTFSAVGTNANGLETILNNPTTEIIEGANS